MLSVVTVNLKNLKSNYEFIKKTYGNNIISVVKKDGYGHGLDKVSKALNSVGAKFFAVSSYEEALIIRKQNIKNDILIMGYTPLNKIPLLIKHNLTQSVYSYIYAKNINNYLMGKNLKLKCQIKIDTGMHRIGYHYKDDLYKIFKTYKFSNLIVRGIYSHYFDATNKKSNNTIIQYKKFQSVKKYLKDKKVNIGITHIQNTDGLINFNKFKEDYLRLGLILYGYGTNFTLKPCMGFTTKIIHISYAKKGDQIGYAGEYTANKNIKLGVIPIGYANGFNPTKNFCVKINGIDCPVLGKVCMNQTIIHLKLKNVKIGDKVVVFNTCKDLINLANAENKSVYECLCTIGMLNNKRYI